MFIPLPTTIIMSDAYSFGQTAIIQCPFTMILQSWILVVSMVEVVRSLVVLRDGGYEGVTIAFHSSIQEDPKLVENVKVSDHDLENM